MLAMRVGDEAMIRVPDGMDPPEKQTLRVQVIGYDDEQVLCYVPAYEHTRASFTAVRHHQKHFGFDDKFLGEEVIFITQSTEVIRHFPAPVGEACKNCGNFSAWALADEDGTFTCKPCRDDPWR